MIIEYLLFIGSGLYLISTILFFYVWLKSLKIKDGTGLSFLQILSICLSLGSLSIFVIRILSEYGQLPLLTARAIAIINPISLVGVGLYLNYLIRHKQK